MNNSRSRSRSNKKGRKERKKRSNGDKNGQRKRGKKSRKSRNRQQDHEPIPYAQPVAVPQYSKPQAMQNMYPQVVPIPGGKEMAKRTPHGCQNCGYERTNTLQIVPYYAKIIACLLCPLGCIACCVCKKQVAKCNHCGIQMWDGDV